MASWTQERPVLVLRNTQYWLHLVSGRPRGINGFEVAPATCV